MMTNFSVTQSRLKVKFNSNLDGHSMETNGIESTNRIKYNSLSTWMRDAFEVCSSLSFSPETLFICLFSSSLKGIWLLWFKVRNRFSLLTPLWIERKHCWWRATADIRLHDSDEYHNTWVCLPCIWRKAQNSCANATESREFRPSGASSSLSKWLDLRIKRYAQMFHRRKVDFSGDEERMRADERGFFGWRATTTSKQLTV